MEHTVNKGLTELMQRFVSDMDKNQESTTYEAELIRQAKAALARLEARPRVNCRVTGLVYGSPELVHQGPQPEAHKPIHDYRDQLAAKKKRRKR